MPPLATQADPTRRARRPAPDIARRPANRAGSARDAPAASATVVADGTAEHRLQRRRACGSHRGRCRGRSPAPRRSRLGAAARAHGSRRRARRCRQVVEALRRSARSKAGALPLRSAAWRAQSIESATCCAASQRLNGSGSWPIRKSRSSGVKSDCTCTGAENSRKSEGIGRARTPSNTTSCWPFVSSITPCSTLAPVTSREAQILPVRTNEAEGDRDVHRLLRLAVGRLRQVLPAARASGARCSGS